jgi:hypothetical protein
VKKCDWKRVFLLLMAIQNVCMAEVPNEILAVWANEAMVATYTYDGSQFMAQQKSIATYFTAPAWTAFTSAQLKANIPDTVMKNQLNVTAVALKPPMITVKPTEFIATMPLLVQYQNKNTTQQQSLDVTLHFIQVANGLGVRGFQITSMTTVSRTSTLICKESD